MVRICWSQLGCLAWGPSTTQCNHVHIVRANVHHRVTVVSHIYCSWNFPIMSECTCHSHFNQMQDCWRPCQSYTCQSHTCQSHTCQSHTCQSHTCQSQVIKAGIISDYVRTYFHSRNYLRRGQSHTCPRGGIVSNNIKAYIHSWDCQRLCESHTCQSHINQNRIVRPYQSRTCQCRVEINTRKFCSTTVIRKLSIISESSLAADLQVTPSYPVYIQIANSWWTCLDCLFTWWKHASQCIHSPTTVLVQDHFAGLVRVTGGSSGRAVELCVYIVLHKIFHQKRSIYHT